jgi:hypothetical protein
MSRTSANLFGGIEHPVDKRRHCRRRPFDDYSASRREDLKGTQRLAGSVVAIAPFPPCHGTRVRGQVRASWRNRALNPRVVPAQQNGSDAAVGSTPADPPPPGASWPSRRPWPTCRSPAPRTRTRNIAGYGYQREPIDGSASGYLSAYTSSAFIRHGCPRPNGVRGPNIYADHALPRTHSTAAERRAPSLPAWRAAGSLYPVVQLWSVPLLQGGHLDVAGPIGGSEWRRGSKSAPPRKTTFTETS